MDSVSWAKGEKMADYISRQAAINAFCEYECGKGFTTATCDCECGKIFNEIPAADVRENVRGEWIRHNEIKNVYGGIYIECSECGEKYVVQHIEDEKYCRNCGFDMRGNTDA